MSARCRNCDPVPWFGPVVVMVRVTGTAPVVPAAICVGMVWPVLKAQLAFVSVVSVGAKVQPKVTVLVNCGAPVGVVGVAVKL